MNEMTDKAIDVDQDSDVIDHHEMVTRFLEDNLNPLSAALRERDAAHRVVAEQALLIRQLRKSAEQTTLRQRALNATIAQASALAKEWSRYEPVGGGYWNGIGSAGREILPILEGCKANDKIGMRS